MNKLIILVGVPASGKSTLAIKFKDQYNAEIISSDSLREELYGNVNDMKHNKEIFDEMFRRAKYYLSNDKNVIIDATNIYSNRRIEFLQQFKEVEKICYFIRINDLHTLYQRNKMRERQVPENIIKFMFNNLQEPIYSEGWNMINIVEA